MSIISRMRRQLAYYWAMDGHSDTGRPLYATAITVKCRWEDVNELFVDAQGQERRSSAKVYPDQVLTLDGILIKAATPASTVDDLFNSHNPHERLNGVAYSIKRFDTIPNFRATENLYIAYL